VSAVLWFVGGFISGIVATAAAAFAFFRSYELAEQHDREQGSTP
jgi:hypothetical protein